ncbi:hypothetical protein ACIQBJ_07990 [Kitasatospora sp. NPDC088391]|uniref:hypothetical protein n=1 Tax=Kitasatospora sp. NPDC088391 TaxID=3364074 RepID=UPI0038166655
MTAPGRTGTATAEAAEAAGVLEARLAGPLTPVALRLLATDLTGVPVPSWPDPALRALVGRHPAERLRTVGRWLVGHGGGRNAVLAGLALLAETSVAEDVPLLRAAALRGSPFGVLAARALERLPAPAPVLAELADEATGTARVPFLEALGRLADPRARLPWYRGGRDPLADPDRPADPAAVAWLRRRAVDDGDFGGYYAARTVVAAAVDRAVADPAAGSEVVDQAGRLLRTLTGCAGMGPTLSALEQGLPLLAHYADRVVRLAPTVDRCTSVLTLAADLADPDGDTARAGWPPGVRAELASRLLELLRRPGWAERLAELLASPRGNLAPWSALLAERLGLRPPGTAAEAAAAAMARRRQRQASPHGQQPGG